MTANDKTALITGAASRIGASIAKALHKRGFSVLIHYNSSQTAADELMDEGKCGKVAVVFDEEIK